MKEKTEIIKNEKEGEKMQVIAKVLGYLNFLRKQVRENSPKINPWVGGYIEKCILEGKPVEILTQWCMAKGLESRYEKQGNKFVPLSSECDIIRKMADIISSFNKEGIRVNWNITFNPTFLDDGRVSEKQTEQYIEMVKKIVRQNEILEKNAILIDWEKEVLGSRPKPSQQVLDNFFAFVDPKAFEIDFKNLLRRVKNYPDFAKTEEQLLEEIKLKIACEAEEARFLTSKESLFKDGDFIIIPLEFAERYVFFNTLVSDFSKRVVAVLKPYPWRMDEVEYKKK